MIVVADYHDLIVRQLPTADCDRCRFETSANQSIYTINRKCSPGERPLFPSALLEFRSTGREVTKCNYNIYTPEFILNKLKKKKNVLVYKNAATKVRNLYTH